MRNAILIYSIVIVISFLLGCSKDENSAVNTDRTSQVSGRWYSIEQVERGKPVYQVHCAVCHQPDASGTKDWKTPDAAGNYPPPPLNGTAHTWHHPMSVLQRTIRNGGIPLGGVMPPFKDKLSNQEVDNIIAFVQSHWSDEVYAHWLQRDQ